MVMVKIVKKFGFKKVKCNVLNGVVYIQSIFNNIIVFIIDMVGEVILWLFVGVSGFKGVCKGIFFVV